MTSQIKGKKVNHLQYSRRFFTEEPQNGEKKFYNCTVCSAKINGTSASNLVSHLKKHKELFAKIAENESIGEKRLGLLLSCVQYIAIDGRPFNDLDKSGFLSLIAEKLRELEDAGQAINLMDMNQYEVKDMVRNIAKLVQEKIRDEIQGRPISLMVDISTKRRRSILGVSAQFLVNACLN